MKESSEVRIANMSARIKTSLTPGEIARLILLIQPVPSTGQMTAEAFDDLMRAIEASKGTRMFAEKSISAAKLILVMGATPNEAAAELGMTVQAVGQALKRIKQKAAEQPKGWTIINEYLPADLATAVREIGKVLRRVAPTEGKSQLDVSQRHELAEAEYLLLRTFKSISVDKSQDILEVGEHIVS
ncbi:TrfB-related DNA-binding protein [Pseudomonas viridiflava]|uniref:TrfB-related DNA-binding protein n=1 Tax=Pseudomonas viridiflava TaxID=33069 RepID=UPI0013DB2CFD|nr:TrfB-related DNA-binding protein [Pseudomonas viridiflava]